MRKLELSFDHLPAFELSPNARLHWAVKRQFTQDAKAEIGWLAKEKWHDNKPMMKARISYEFHFKDKRRRDLDNLLSSCKAYQDGLIEVGVLFYDDAAHLEIAKIRGVFDDHEETIIKLTEVA